MIYLHLLLKCQLCTVWVVLEMVSKILVRNCNMSFFDSTTLIFILALELFDFVILTIEIVVIQLTYY